MSAALVLAGLSAFALEPRTKEAIEKIKAAIEKELAGKNSVKLWDTNDESGERIRVQLKERADRAVFSRALRSAGIIGGMVSAENEQNNPVFKRNVSYTDKVYRNAMMEINEVQRQHRAQR